MRVFLLLPLVLLCSGCLVRTAADIVTAPIRVGGAIVDAATTSQSEADEKRGREMRKAEERAERERRKAEREARQAAGEEPFD